MKIIQIKMPFRLEQCLRLLIYENRFGHGIIGSCCELYIFTFFSSSLGSNLLKYFLVQDTGSETCR